MQESWTRAVTKTFTNIILLSFISSLMALLPTRPLEIHWENNTQEISELNENWDSLSQDVHASFSILRAGVRLFMTAPYNPRTTPIEEHFGVLKTVARFKHMEHADLRRRSFKDYSRRVSRHWATEVILQTDIFAMQDFT